MLYFNIPIKRHIAHHDANVFRRDTTVVIEVVHSECETHFFLQVAHKDCAESINKGLLSDIVALLLLLKILLGCLLGTAHGRVRAISSRHQVALISLRKHDV